MVFLCLVMLFPMASMIGQEQASAATEQLALAAYRELLTTPQTMETEWGFVTWGIQDVLYAELVDFDNNGIPELVLLISYAVYDDGFIEWGGVFTGRIIIVVGYAGRAEMLYSGVVWEDAGGFSWYTLATSPGGQSYLVHEVLEGTSRDGNRYLTIRNDVWQNALHTQPLRDWGSGQGIDFFYDPAALASLGISSARRLVSEDNYRSAQSLLVEIDRRLSEITTPTPPPPPPAADYSYDEIDPGASIIINRQLLAGVDDHASAQQAITTMVGALTNEQRQSATGIDLMTLFAEEASARAATTAVSGSDVVINISGVLSTYTDASAIPEWARIDVALATRENLVVRRTDGAFNGTATMTRGEAALILYRMFMKIW